MPKVAPKKSKKYAFKVNAGAHREGGVTYNVGDVVETDNDLRKHNTKMPGAKPKFLLMGAESEVEPVSASNSSVFENMTVEELKSYAAEGDIQLPEGANKSQIIAKLLESE